MAQQHLTQTIALRPALNDLAESREGHRLEAVGQHRAALQLYSRALARHEEQRRDFLDQSNYTRLLASKQNRLARFLVTCADEQIRDVKLAVELAEKSVENAPQEGLFWSTLGAAHYRVGNWSKCITALEHSMQRRNRGDGLDWLFLAMANQQLGKADDAHKWLDKGLAWIEQMEKGESTNPVDQTQWQLMRPEVEVVRQEALELVRPRPTTTPDK